MRRILETPDMEHVRHKYEEMKAKLDGLWDSLYSEWASRVPGEVSTNLVKTLLTRHEDNTISTNFAPEVRAEAMESKRCSHSAYISLDFSWQLVAALRECRYLQFLGLEDIPAPAKELFDRSEELHLWVTTLNRIVEWWEDCTARLSRAEALSIRSDFSSNLILGTTRFLTAASPSSSTSFDRRWMASTATSRRSRTSLTGSQMVSLLKTVGLARGGFKDERFEHCSAGSAGSACLQGCGRTSRTSAI